MARTSRLLHASARRTGNVSGTFERPEVLFSCDDGIPLLWLLCFGSRNTYEAKDDAVRSRGYTGSERDRFEAAVEDAQFRLESAENNLRGSEDLWPWFGAIPLLTRKLKSRPKQSAIYLEVPWVASNSPEYNDLRETIALCESAVNFLSRSQFAGAQRSLEKAARFCPALFLGDGRDAERLKATRSYATESDLAIRVALLTLGTPAKDMDGFRAFAREQEPSLLEAIKRAESKPKAQPAGAAAPAAPQPGVSKGFAQRLFGLFGKKS